MHLLAQDTAGWQAGYTIGGIVVLAAVERIRGAADNILGHGVGLIGNVDAAPALLAQTDETIKEVQVGAVRYAGSVAKLLP